eukprot:scaffold1074_cov409-Prasinococcus_capsulatus_cf.AAC.23
MRRARNSQGHLMLSTQVLAPSDWELGDDEKASYAHWNLRIVQLDTTERVNGTLGASARLKYDHDG